MKEASKQAVRPNTGLSWPELYGFQVYGFDSTYIIHVDPNSVAGNAGIKPGDAIIELDGQNVSKKPSSYLKQLARSSIEKTGCPPAISVQTACERVELVPDSKAKFNMFGFTVKSDIPILIDLIDLDGPAYSKGVRSGDILLELNDKQVKFCDSAKMFINNSTSNLIIKFIPLSGSQNNPNPQTKNGIDGINSQFSMEVSVNASSGNSSLNRESDLLKTKLERAQIFYNTVNKKKQILIFNR
jgi:membrane-associated protease RseP (regulator of RpoE activity)